LHARDFQYIGKIETKYEEFFFAKRKINKIKTFLSSGDTYNKKKEETFEILISF
jgi:hypothetical protein